MSKKPLTVAWISDFPLEWLPDLPKPLQALPRRHPTTWQRVLLAEYEKDPSIKVHVIVLRKRMAEDYSFERNGTVFHVLKASAALRVASFFWLDTLRIKKACEQISPDLVHAWGSEKGAALIADRLRFPYVATVQGLFGWYKELVPIARYEKFVEFLERRSFPRAPVLTTECRFAVQYLKERYAHLHVHQAEHAPNHVFHQVRRRPTVRPIQFIFLGSLGYRKGTDLLFQALDRLKGEIPFKLTAISEQSAESIQARHPEISSELWSRIEFKRGLLPDQVAKEFETPTMMLFPTRADVSPNAVKEAVVTGMPVVGSEIGGIPDYVFPGKNGFLFPSNDVNAFVSAIRNACAHPLFSQGLVDPDTLVKTRVYLSPGQMAVNFTQAYEVALAKGRRP
jgi:glycosyltransferase involved in cell wall biosynthesis